MSNICHLSSCKIQVWYFGADFPWVSSCTQTNYHFISCPMYLLIRKFCFYGSFANYFFFHLPQKPPQANVKKLFAIFFFFYYVRVLLLLVFEFTSSKCTNKLQVNTTTESRTCMAKGWWEEHVTIRSPGVAMCSGQERPALLRIMGKEAVWPAFVSVCLTPLSCLSKLTVCPFCLESLDQIASVSNKQADYFMLAMAFPARISGNGLLGPRGAVARYLNVITLAQSRCRETLLVLYCTLGGRFIEIKGEIVHISWAIPSWWPAAWLILLQGKGGTGFECILAHVLPCWSPSPIKFTEWFITVDRALQSVHVLLFVRQRQKAANLKERGKGFVVQGLRWGALYLTQISFVKYLSCING